MIFEIFYVTALGVLQIVSGTSEGGRKYRSLGRVNYNENSFRCPAEGFYPDARDCRTFYRCVDWTSNDYFRDYNESQLTAFRFECGEGAVFDPDYNVCNHPRDTRRAECGGRRPGENNNEAYGTPHGINAQGSQIYPSQSQSGYPDQEGLPNESENQIMPSKEGVTSQITLGASENCQSSGFYPVKGNCQKFIRCVDNGKGGYTKYEFACGPGTVWDSVNSACNYPSQVPGCRSSGAQGGAPGQGGYPKPEGAPGQGGYPGPEGTPGQGGYPGPEGTPGQGGYPGPEETPGQGGYPKPGGAPGQGGYPGPGGTPGQGGYPGPEGSSEQGGNDKKPEGGIFSGRCTAPGFYGVPGNCKKFIRCVDNGNGAYIKYDFDCSPGTAWDDELNTCNHASMVRGCENSNKIPAEEGGQGSYPDSGMPQQGGYPKPQMPEEGDYPRPGMPEQGGYSESDNLSNNENQNPPSGDPSECQNDGFYPVKNNCKAFFRCVSKGKEGFLRYDFLCGEGTLWDQENQVCNYPRDIARSDSNCATSSANQLYNQTTSSASSTFSQSTSYYNTSTTSGQNQFSSSSTTTQTGSSQSQSQSVTDSQTQTQGSQTISIQGTNQYPGSRPTDQGSTKPMLPQPKPTTDTPVSGASSSSEDPSKPPPGSSPCDKNKMPSQVKCEKDGFYPDPKDCSKFYRCVDWGNKKFSVYYFECGKGTIWDPAIETCNHEKSVYPLRDCSSSSDANNKKPSIDQNTASSTTTEPNKNSPVKKPSPTIPINAATTKRPITTTNASTESSTATQSTTTESSILTDMPTTQTSPTDAPDITTSSTDQTESNTNPTGATAVTESITSVPNSSISSTDTTESTTKAEGISEITTESGSNPSEESTEGSTLSQTESTTSNLESTESAASSTNSELTELTTPVSSSESIEPTESTTLQGTITTETSSNRDPNCPQLNADQSAFVCPTGFRRHPKNCNLFYQCTMSKDTGDINIMVLSCKNNTMYDERKIQCLSPEETDACQNQMQGRRVYRRAEDEFSSLVYVSPHKRLCPEEGSFPYEGDCTRFYKCKKDNRQKIQGYLYQCPENYSFQASTGMCEKTSTLPQCARSIPEVTIKSMKWMRAKVPVEYSNLAFR